MNSKPETRNPKPVLMLTGEYPPRRGGVGDYTARLAEALVELGQPVTVLTSAETGGVPADAPPARREVGDWGFGCWRRVLTALNQSGARVLHIQYQAGAFQLRGAVNLLPLWLRRQRPAVQVVTTFHDLLLPYLFPKAGPFRPLAVRLLLRGSHGAIFVDPADLARAGAGSNRRWVPVGSNLPCEPPPDFDRAALRAALGAGPNDLLIGYFGFLTASKGADDLLQAVRLLRDQGRPVRLALIGAGAGASNASDRADQRAAEALTERLGLGPRLARTGYLEPGAVSAHLLACDLIALPYRDGASFRRGSLLAALEHRRPIVTTPPVATAGGSGARQLVAGRHFLAAPPGDPAALAEAIGSLADQPALATRLAAAAKALAAECSWPAIASETLEVYRRCFEPAARRPT